MFHTNSHNFQNHWLGISLIVLLGTVLGLCPLSTAATVPDPVLEWDAIMNDTVLAGGTNPLVTTRVVALVSASVFDAVNGIWPRYTPLHVSPAAPRNASQRAAAVQAAYAMLIRLYPGADCDAHHPARRFDCGDRHAGES